MFSNVINVNNIVHNVQIIQHVSNVMIQHI